MAFGGPYGFERTSDQPIKLRGSVLLYNNQEYLANNRGVHKKFVRKEISTKRSNSTIFL